MFDDQEGSSETWTPRNVKVCTLSTYTLLMQSGHRSVLPFFRKSNIISFVLVVFSVRLFTEHHYDGLLTTSLYADSSPPEISPTMVVSSTDLTMVLDEWAGVHSKGGVASPEDTYTSCSRAAAGLALLQFQLTHLNSSVSLYSFKL